MELHLVIQTNEYAINVAGYSLSAFEHGLTGYCVDGDFGLMYDFATLQEAIQHCKWEMQNDPRIVDYYVDC